jgi:GT2 family glycosyltransferase
MPETSRARPLLPAISVVIPTYNRGALLIETLERCRASAGPVELEFVVIDDGSRDDTAARLERLASKSPDLKWRSIPNGGAGRARNLGASLAKHEVILFLGDDIQPQDDDFFAVHAQLHAAHPEREFGMLGKVVWPNRPDSLVNFVMGHVQGRGGEQFGYADLKPYSRLDWRFFYTANVSVKRELVDDWIEEGFSAAFTRCNYEDGEFAYRMMKRERPLELLFVPGALAAHHHAISAETFMERQVWAGMMARVFVDLHDDDPELPIMLGLGPISHALEVPVDAEHPILAPDLLAVIEGVKGWVRVIERMQRIGSQWWHDDLLRAAFTLCYKQGFVFACNDPTANVAAAAWLIIHDFTGEMRRTIETEILGTSSGRWDLAGLFSMGSGSAGISQSGSQPTRGRLRRSLDRTLRSVLLLGPHRLPWLRDRVKGHRRIAAAFRKLRLRFAGVA